MYTKFNINATVKVKLSERGKQIHREEWECVFGNNPNFTYSPPQEDEEGYSKWQMWSLMEMFGSYCGLGFDLPFHTDILIELK
jgi:hypothetical protein